ncbi:MAG TPA: hypothetical protein VM261_19910 [Kofleriaceae bacterium]|nr:hypothetical protein [Kofleriaceae bacterium]
MLAASERLRLTYEALTRARIGDELDGDHATELALARGVHRAHASGAQRTDDLEIVEARRRRHHAATHSKTQAAGSGMDMQEVASYKVLWVGVS